MFSKAFWKAAAERAVKTGSQALILAWPVADGVLDIFEVDFERGASVFLGGAVLSVLTSLISAGAGNPGPSLANESVQPVPPSERITY
jgi:hypothetical protein